jgi:hypothetical protein
VATPDIGTSISEGYSRGLDRLGAIAGAAVVPAVVVGVVGAVVSYIQTEVISDSAEEIVENIFSGKGVSDFSFADRLAFNGLGAVQQLVFVVVYLGVMSVITGALHRERHGGEFTLPGPGESMGATLGAFSKLMPRAGLLVLLSIAGPIAGILSSILGGLVSLVAGIALIYLSVKWIYAVVVAGSDEAEGDAAFDRSEAATSGSWWGTFGTFIVIGIAVGLPVAIVAAILGAVLGGINSALGSFATLGMYIIGMAAIGASALESAWAQVEEKTGLGGGGYAGHDHIEPAAPAEQPPATPESPADTEGHSGPFV